MSDFFNALGSEYTGPITGVAGNSRGWGGAIANIGMYEGAPFPMASGGVPSTTAFNQLCGKTQEFHTWASNNGGVWRSLYPLSDGGIWGDDGNAQITGYITNVGGSAATLNVVSTTAGSLAVATGTQTAYLSGPGLVPSSAPTITLTTSASSTYSITPTTTAALGSSGSSVTFSVGAYQPVATPAKTSVATSSNPGICFGVDADRDRRADIGKRRVCLLHRDVQRRGGVGEPDHERADRHDRDRHVLVGRRRQHYSTVPAVHQWRVSPVVDGEWRFVAVPRLCCDRPRNDVRHILVRRSWRIRPQLQRQHAGPDPRLWFDDALCDDWLSVLRDIYDL